MTIVEAALLFLGQINLKTNNVAILNFTLTERTFRLHQFNHSRFDFLEKLERSSWRPTHTLVDEWHKISYLSCFWDVNFPNTIKCLF